MHTHYYNVLIKLLQNFLVIWLFWYKGDIMFYLFRFLVSNDLFLAFVCDNKTESMINSLLGVKILDYFLPFTFSSLSSGGMFNISSVSSSIYGGTFSTKSFVVLQYLVFLVFWFLNNHELLRHGVNIHSRNFIFMYHVHILCSRHILYSLSFW